MQLIFCPQCNTLVLDAAVCPNCGWQRPRAAGEVGHAMWQIELGRALPKPLAAATIAGERFCVATEEGAVIALDIATGQMAWERTIGAGAALTLAASGSRLLVGAMDLRPLPGGSKPLLALDATTGETIWQYETAAHSLSAAALDGETAYVTTSDGLLHAVDVTTGRRRWVAQHGPWGPSAPAAGEGVVCAGGRGDALVVYADEDGRELWRAAGPAWFAHPLSIADGRVFAPCWDGNLYVFDPHDGHKLWAYTAERGSGMTSTPCVDGDLVVFGGRVYREAGGQREAGYALLALRAEDGAEQWRFPTARPVVAPTALADDTVLFGADDGHLYALDLASGAELWRFALDGRPVTQPQIDGEMACVATRNGSTYALRWRLGAREQLLASEEYLAKGEHEQAAIAYALAGDLAGAAAIFEQQLDQDRRAAQLYERAGQPAKAAMLWEQAGELRHARDLYTQAGYLPGIAGALEHMGELLEAARVYEQTGMAERAASLYERAGDRIKAAELYDQQGKFAQAAAIWESLGMWDRLVQDKLADGAPSEAARILELQGQLERAADLYENTGELEQALQLRLKLGHWERVASLASQLGSYAPLAEAHEQLGQSAQAAEAYEREAGRLATAHPADGARAAMLFEKAAELYDAALADEDLARCRQQVVRLRQLPEIAVSGGAQSAFVEFEWNTLSLLIKNTGYGPATQIQVAFRGAFDIEGNNPIERLPAKKTAPIEIYVRPQPDYYGPKVPLQISVTYQDRAGGQYSLTQRLPLRVLPKGSAAEQQTPLEIDIRGELPRASASHPVSNASLEDIDQQQQLLMTYRRNLAHYLGQKARFGETFVPAHIASSIGEERANILRVKSILGEWGVKVDDHPDDEA
jgi:outer membrane protein assembly factor BamB